MICYRGMLKKKIAYYLAIVAISLVMIVFAWSITGLNRDLVWMTTCIYAVVITLALCLTIQEVAKLKEDKDLAKRIGAE